MPVEWDDEVCDTDGMGWWWVEGARGGDSLVCRLHRSSSPTSPPAASDVVVVVTVCIDTVSVTFTEMLREDDDAAWMSGCSSVLSTSTVVESVACSTASPAAPADSAAFSSATVSLPPSDLGPVSRPEDASDEDGATTTSDGLATIRLRYQTRLSSNRSRISWQSGWTRSAHVSHSGCTM